MPWLTRPRRAGNAASPGSPRSNRALGRPRPRAAREASVPGDARRARPNHRHGARAPASKLPAVLLRAADLRHGNVDAVGRASLAAPDAGRAETGDRVSRPARSGPVPAGALA